MTTTQVKTRTDCYKEGEEAKKQGKHPLADNPYHIVRQGSSWEAWLCGWEGTPLPYENYQD